MHVFLYLCSNQSDRPEYMAHKKAAEAAIPDDSPLLLPSPEADVKYSSKADLRKKCAIHGLYVGGTVRDMRRLLMDASLVPKKEVLRAEHMNRLAAGKTDAMPSDDPVSLSMVAREAKMANKSVFKQILAVLQTMDLSRRWRDKKQSVYRHQWSVALGDVVKKESKTRCDGVAHDVWEGMEVIAFKPDESCEHEVVLWPLLNELANYRLVGQRSATKCQRADTRTSMSRSGTCVACTCGPVARTQGGN